MTTIWRSNVLDPTGATTLFTVPGVLQDDYALLNGQLGFTFDDGRYRVALWGKNILDEEYIIDGGNTGGVFNIPTFICRTASALRCFVHGPASNA